MLGKMDEYLVHQTVAPLAQVDSGDPHWQDRFYFNLHDQQGDLLIITGLGAYPNRCNMEGYILAVHRGQHYAHFVSRPLAADREEMRAGGLSFTILEPMRRWHLQLAPAPLPVHGQLEFEARCPAYEFATIRWERDGNTVVHQCHYTQAGRYRGTVRVGEEERGGLIGMRDRSWGIRNLAQAEMWIWVSAQMPRGCLTAWQWETASGERIYFDGALVEEDGQVRRLAALQHEVELWPGERRPRRCHLRFRLETGEEVDTLAEEQATIYLGRQPLHWSEEDRDTRAEADAAALGYDQLCRFQGDVEGWGVVEFGLMGGYRRYGIARARLG